ncbi:signal peptide containing protein [Theileria equi strain WA]|uniref:Signal peptide containing protein n=1 Tax=Theileria equi strain WA TaxID=1537102 RepID=L1LCU3_THEEQ|nr:signal peptide containing protein [Theileria equi strain WA]EKX73070.1 signal peptide containing protein [Theileria equi strain WA]|eukprot:XP_004832522.1 signal peptide containing protein [Theileria equi strain WA]
MDVRGKMNVFSILLVTCLLGFCHCNAQKTSDGRFIIEVLDDYAEDGVVTSNLVDEVDAYKSTAWTGKKQVWDLSNGTAHEVEHRPSSTRRRNGRKVEDVAAEESAEQDGVTLDLTSPDEDEYDSFAGNEGKRVAPKKKASVIRSNTKKLVSKFLDKIDGSLFDLEGGEEGGVVTLQLTAKNGVTTNKLVYDDQVVWEDPQTPCLSAVLYMDKEKPTLAVVDFQCNGNVTKVHKYYDGNQWQNGSEDGHANRLGILKDNYRPTMPATLDLAKPDKGIDVNVCSQSGMSFKEYTPKDWLHISSVMDGGFTLWEAEGDERCLLAESYAKNNVELLSLKASDNSGTKSKYFEKADGVWSEVDKDEFVAKIKTMIEGSGKLP